MFKNLNLNDHFDLHNKRQVTIIVCELVLILLALLVILLVSNQNANTQPNLNNNQDSLSYPTSYPVSYPLSYPIANETNGKSIVARFMDNGEKTIEAQAQPDGTTTKIFVLKLTNLYSATCKFSIYKVAGVTESLVYEEDQLVAGPESGKLLTFTEGQSNLNIDCFDDVGDIYRDRLTITVSPAPVAEEHNYELNLFFDPDLTSLHAISEVEEGGTIDKTVMMGAKIPNSPVNCKLSFYTINENQEIIRTPIEEFTLEFGGSRERVLTFGPGDYSLLLECINQEGKTYTSHTLSHYVYVREV